MRTVIALVTTVAAVGAVLLDNLLGWALTTAETRPWTYALAAALVVGALVVLRHRKSAVNPTLERDLSFPPGPTGISEHTEWTQISAASLPYYGDVLSPPPRTRSRSLALRAFAAAAIVLAAIAALFLLLPWMILSL